MSKPRTLERFIQAAKEEDWVYVDRHLTGFLRPDIVQWAKKEGLSSTDSRLRHLAARILEKCYHEFETDQPLLLEILLTIQKDENRFVRFRLVFALWRQGDRSPFITGVMGEAARDSDRNISAAAENYLSGGE